MWDEKAFVYVLEGDYHNLNELLLSIVFSIIMLIIISHFKSKYYDYDSLIDKEVRI